MHDTRVLYHPSAESYNRNLLDYREAHRQGLRSRSAWEREGRVVTDTNPTAIVVQKTEKVAAPAPSWSPVVLDEGRYLVVASSFYPVYSFTQTIPKEQQREEEEERGEGEQGSNTIGESSQHLAIAELASPKTEPKKRPVNSVRRYTPEGVEDNPLIRDHPDRDQILSFFDLIIWERIRGHRKRHEFVPLKAAYLDNEFSGFRRFWPDIHGKLVERDGYYVKGYKSFGYRLAENVRDNPYHAVDIEDRTVIKRHKAKLAAATKKPVHAYLYEQLQTITVDEDGFRDRYHARDNYEDHAMTARAINEGAWHFDVDAFGNRVHTNITNITKHLRPFLRVNGTPLVELDVKNCQPTVLAGVMIARGRDPGRFLDYVQDGTIYDVLAQITGQDRETTKVELLRTIFAKNGYRSHLKQVFEMAFAAAARFMEEAKDKDHKKLAALLQREEAKLIIHGVADRFRRTGRFLTTIHDSFLCLPDDQGTVFDLINDEFAQRNLKAKVRVSDLEFQTESSYDDDLSIPTYSTEEGQP